MSDVNATDDVDQGCADFGHEPPPNASAFTVGDHVELARALVNRLGGPEDVIHDELHKWRYEGAGVWAEIGRDEQSRIVQGYSGAAVGSTGKPLKVKATDVSGSIALSNDQVSRPGFFYDAPRGITFANGFLRVSAADGAVLEPHAREHRSRAGYAFDYSPRALPRRFLEFLAALFRDDEDRCEKEMLVQEFFGACLLGIAPVYQRCIIAIGGGDNGKSKLVDAMIAAMPAGKVSAIPPQELGNEYKRAMLLGKHLNAVGELPERDIIASESFKAIVAGDPIVARVIRESPVMARPIAGHYFAANGLPGTSDQTDGFWRRFSVLTFNRSFKGDPTRDPQIIERIIATETPLIVSWLVDGVVRLIRERGYTIPQSHHAALAAWRKTADQAALFLDAETRPLAIAEHPARGVYAADLYIAYRRWCEANGHRAMASNKLGTRLRDLGVPSTKTKFGWRYPLAMLTAADRVRVTDGDMEVTDYPSPKSREVASA